MTQRSREEIEKQLKRDNPVSTDEKRTFIPLDIEILLDLRDTANEILVEMQEVDTFKS